MTKFFCYSKIDDGQTFAIRQKYNYVFYAINIDVITCGSRAEEYEKI